MSLFGTCSDRLKLRKSGKKGTTITKNVKDRKCGSVYGKDWIQSTRNRSFSWDVALKGERSGVFFGLVSKGHHGDTERGIYDGHGKYMVAANGWQFVDGLERSSGSV